MISGQPFNPFRLFYGVFIPEALVRFPDVSPGAKLCYGRLTRYAGEKGTCYPSQDTLAGELGVSARNVRRYIEELRSVGLIRTVRRGLQLNNEYEFLWHAIFDGSERTDSSGQDRTDASPMDRTRSSAPSKRESLKRESVPRESASSTPTPPSSSSEKRSHNGLSHIQPEDLEAHLRQVFMDWEATQRD